MKRFQLTSLFLLCTGCSIVPLKLYEGHELPPEEIVTFRIHGPLDGPTHTEEISPAVTVKKMDGLNINGDRSYKAYVLPGKHTFHIMAIKDASTVACMVIGGVCGYKYSEKSMEVDTKKGHTYIFTAVDEGEVIVFGYEDKGLNYNSQCLDAEGWSRNMTIRNPNIKGC